MATSPDYPILGPPRISFDGFAVVLRDNRSPSAGEAAGCYRAFTGYGVDPAVGLAMFRKESTFGRFGYANRNRSWGNIRDPRTGQFRAYPTWTAGALDCARLLAVYGANRIRPGVNTSTVQTMPFVWAPAADGNAPDRYGDQLVAWITDWSRRYPAAGSSAPPLPGAPVSDEKPTDPEEIRRRALELLRQAGITSTSPTYVFTRDDARAIAKVLYGQDPDGLIGSRLVARWTGRTIADWIGASDATGYEGNLLDDWIEQGAAAAGAVLTNIVVLVAIVAIVVLALYLLARSS